ncbi:MAG: DUF4304 domain-containing protein [Janthinobacterium lividum]
MASDLENRFNSIIRVAMTTPLTQNGFRKRGRVFSRQLDGLAWLIEIQRSRHNSKEQTAFTVDCGIYVPGVMNLYIRIPAPTVPTTIDCCIRIGNEMLTEESVNGWWTLYDPPHTVQEDAEILNDLHKRVFNHVLPFLNEFPSTSEVAQYLERPRANGEQRITPGTYAMALGCAGIIRLLRDERKAAIEALSKAVQEASGSPGEQHLRLLERHLLSVGPFGRLAKTW